MTEPSELPPPTPLPRGRPPAQRPTFGDLVLVGLAIFAIQYGLARLVVETILPVIQAKDDWPLLVLLVVGFLSLASIAAIQLLVLRRRNLGFENLGLRPFPPEWRRRTATVTLMSFALVILIRLLMLGYMDEAPDNPQVRALTFDQPSLLTLLLSFLVVSAIVPLFEELLFRGLLFGWLRLHLGTYMAAAISALAFAAAHGMLFAIPAVFVLGVILALLYERSGSLWPAIICHGGYNALMLSLFYLSKAAGLELPA